MKEIRVRNTVFGKGIPLICIPVTGINEEEIAEQTEAALKEHADVIEWRADWFEEVSKPGTVINMLTHLRKQLGETPLLFTFRSKKEGGEKEITVSDYKKLLMAVMESGMADLMDIELFTERETLQKLIQKAREHELKTVLSSHDFNKTPENNEMLERFEAMCKLGADLAKLAVMPENQKDVFRLMEVSAQFTSSYDCPVIAISMGKQGVITRIAGESFGSVMTFATASKASAPGQIPASQLRKVLIELHESL